MTSNTCILLIIIHVSSSSSVRIACRLTFKERRRSSSLSRSRSASCVAPALLTSTDARKSAAGARAVRLPPAAHSTRSCVVPGRGAGTCGRERLEGGRAAFCARDVARDTHVARAAFGAGSARQRGSRSPRGLKVSAALGAPEAEPSAGTSAPQRARISTQRGRTSALRRAHPLAPGPRTRRDRCPARLQTPRPAARSLPSWSRAWGKDRLFRISSSPYNLTRGWTKT